MNQKIETSLELALSVPNVEREKTRDLDIGYDVQDNVWDVIVQYSGDIGQIASDSITVIELYGGYAILRLPERELERVASLPVIDYVEKPKQLYFEVSSARYASCIPAVERAPYNLSGRGVLVGIVDSGIDYSHPDFRNEDGTTRILDLWDQERDEVYTREQINEALSAPTIEERYRIVPSRDVSGHGTHVAGIAAGNGRASGGEYIGTAPQSSLIIVKMKNAQQNGFPRTTELMRGVDYLVRKGVEMGMPMAVNVSFGNNYGSHDGTSLVETYLDNVAGIGRTVITVGSGNEGAKRRHNSGVLQKNQSKLIEFVVGENEPNLNIQIWKNYVDSFRITLLTPSSETVVLSEESIGAFRQTVGNNTFLWLFGEPTPYSVSQEIYLEMIPTGNLTTIQTGVWKLILEPKDIVDGRYQMWMPAGIGNFSDTGFLVPNEDVTLTIPSTALKVITVGAYDSNNESVASFSGRGPTANGRQKPTLVAPGVSIISTSNNGSYSVLSGTSMATPFVTGASALLMEWGIVNGNDPYLYGQKVKAYLEKGAKPLAISSGTRGADGVPNPITGWGALCVKDSLPV